MIRDTLRFVLNFEPPELQAPQSDDVMMMYYQLPAPHLEGESQLAREVEICTLIWALSTLLPLVYMGHKEDMKKQPKVCTCDDVMGDILYGGSMEEVM